MPLTTELEKSKRQQKTAQAGADENLLHAGLTSDGQLVLRGRGAVLDLEVVVVGGALAVGHAGVDERGGVRLRALGALGRDVERRGLEAVVLAHREVLDGEGVGVGDGGGGDEGDEAGGGGEGELHCGGLVVGFL